MVIDPTLSPYRFGMASTVTTAPVTENLSIREFFRILRRFWPYVHRYRGKFYLGLLIILIAVPLGQFAIFLTRDVTNRALLATGLTIDERWAIVVQIVSLQALFWLVSSSLSTAREVLEWFVSMRSTYDLRLNYYRHLYRLPLNFLQQRPPGEHVYRATSDIGPADGDGYAPGTMGMIARMVPQLFETAYAVLWGGLLLYLIDPRLTLLLAIYIIPFFICAHLMYDKMRLTSFAMRENAENEAAVLRDSVKGLRTLKSIGREVLQRRTYARAAGLTKRLQNKLNFQTVATTQGVVWGLRWLFGIYFFVYMSDRVMTGQATVGDWVASFLILAEAQTPLEKAVQIVQTIRMQIVPAQRVLQTLDAPPTEVDAPNASKLGPIEGVIEFKKVSFAYHPGHPVLKDVSCQIAPGTHVGFVGPSGAGKSSLLNLLLRLYRPAEGQVLVDGVDVKTVVLDTLIEQCAVVPQSTYLYDGTIEENILFSNRHVSTPVLEAAIVRSGVADFASQQPLGLNTIVGEGATISGGERQRIGIARALVREPRILILDEATASLDSRTEAEILATLQGVMPGRTVITVAHRLKAVMTCDVIHVLEKGELVESGTHQDLLAKGGLYSRLWEEQLQDDSPLIDEVGDE